MHEITVCFGAVGKVPVEREKLMMQEREERVVETVQCGHSKKAQAAWIV